jgi:hypothetical protein
MSIAYLSTDEVNRHLAGRMAAACGETLHLLSPNDPMPEGPFDAVIYDLDSIPSACREEIVASALADRATRPVAVHSYNLDTQADALRGKGVVVTRRLGPVVLRALSRSLGQAPTTLPPLKPQGGLADPDIVLEITVSARRLTCRRLTSSMGCGSWGGAHHSICHPETPLGTEPPCPLSQC